MTPEFKKWMPFILVIIPAIIVGGILIVLFPFTLGHSYYWFKAMTNWLDAHIPIPFGNDKELEKTWERYKEQLLNEAKKK